jgi:hypothetical protein
LANSQNSFFRHETEVSTCILRMVDDNKFYSMLGVCKTMFNKIYANYFRDETEVEQCNFCCIDVHNARWFSQLEPEYIATNK